MVTMFLKAERVTVLPHTAYSADLADYFVFLKIKFHLSGKNTNQEMLWNLPFTSIL
jgi:hypothetical protein